MNPVKEIVVLELQKMHSNVRAQLHAPYSLSQSP